MRTFVSFESELGREGEPPGLELGRLLWNALLVQGVSADEPEVNDGYGWRIDCKVGNERLFLLIQLTNDRAGRECWLGIVAPTLGLWSRLRHGSGSNQRQLCEAVHKDLAGHPGIREIRWYTREEWEERPEDASSHP